VGGLLSAQDAWPNPARSSYHHPHQPRRAWTSLRQPTVEEDRITLLCKPIRMRLA